MNVVWSPRAINHLAHLRTYIAQDDPTAAAQVAGERLRAVERLAELPNLGRPGRIAGTRELVAPHFSSAQTRPRSLFERPSRRRRLSPASAGVAERTRADVIDEKTPLN